MILTGILNYLTGCLIGLFSPSNKNRRNGRR